MVEELAINIVAYSRYASGVTEKIQRNPPSSYQFS
jgi:hypothetical protein